MSKGREFAKNTIILLIGKFCTQFMSLLLIPLYTYSLSTKDYGYVDLIQTYITLFVPILTLKLDSAAFRFLIDVREDEFGKKKVVSNIIGVLILALIFFSIIYGIIINCIKLQYAMITYFNILILMISNIFLQFLRGLGKNKEYTITSIITAVITVIVNVILIMFLKYNASSILIASSIANIISIIYIAYKIKISKYFKFNYLDKLNLKELLKYSIPMIPNQLSWWIVNVSDRSIITYFLGVSYNGIYTVSCKFSNIINTIFGIFNMSWQETASIHINDDNKEQFFSDIINKVFSLFSSLSLLMIAILPFVFDIIIGNDYRDAYQYIPILLLANMFNILISLFGGIYVALKKIRQIANTTIVSAIINIVLNFIFIKKFGLYAASFSTLIAYLILAIYRYIDVQNYVKIKVDKKVFFLTIILFIFITFSYYYNNLIVNMLIFLIICMYSIFVNKSLLKEGIKILTKRK